MYHVLVFVCPYARRINNDIPDYQTHHFMKTEDEAAAQKAAIDAVGKPFSWQYGEPTKKGTFFVALVLGARVERR